MDRTLGIEVRVIEEKEILAGTGVPGPGSYGIEMKQERIEDQHGFHPLDRLPRAIDGDVHGEGELGGLTEGWSDEEFLGAGRVVVSQENRHQDQDRQEEKNRWPLLNGPPTCNT